MSLNDIQKELYGQKPRKLRVQGEKKAQKEAAPSKDPKKDSRNYTNPWRNEAPFQSEPESPEPIRKAEKIGSRVFVFLAAALVILVGFAGYYLYQYFTTKDARFTISAPAEVRIGEPFVLQAIFENVSKKSLFEPIITIRLPEGALLTQDTSKRVIEERIPDTASGGSVKREYMVVLTGDPYQNYRFSGEISFRYGESTLSSKFQKESGVSVVARNPVLTLDTAMPSSVINGQDFEVQVRYTNETNEPLRDASIIFDLPDSFTIGNSEPKLQEHTVSLAQIGPQEEGLVIVSGFLTQASASSFVPFGVRATVSIAGHAYEIASKTNSISVSASPLAVSLSSDAKNNVVYPGDRIRFKMIVTNNSSVPMQEVRASVLLESAYLNLATLEGSGTLADASRTYTWTAAQLPALKHMDPGASAQTEFTIQLYPGYMQSGAQDKDAQIRLSATAVSQSVPPGLTAQQTIGTQIYTLKVGGAAQLIATAFYAEPGTDITNTGPMPPRVGQQTTFTVHWKVSARGTDAKDIRTQASLGRGFEWTGKVQSLNTARVPQYNPQTQEITWEIEEAKAASPPPEAVFQLVFTPSSNMEGNVYVLLQNIQFSATDAFTNETVTQQTNTLDSRDLADANALQKGYDRVAP